METRNAFRARLEGVSGLTEEDARAQFLDEVREAYRLEALAVGRDLVEAAEEEAKDKAREITLMAIQRHVRPSMWPSPPYARSKFLLTT